MIQVYKESPMIASKKFMEMIVKILNVKYYYIYNKINKIY